MDTTHDLLRELREEVKDWQEALCGERDGLDELCARVDNHLNAPIIAVDFDPATAALTASCIGVGIEGAEDHPEETVGQVEAIERQLREFERVEVGGES